jgi:hypothetical protein
MSRERDYGSWVDLLTDLKNMAVCQEGDKHTEDIKAKFQFSNACIWTMSFEAIFA